jgi:uncharacterized protein DUF6252
MFKYSKSGFSALALLFLISCGKEESIDTLGTTGSPNTAKGKITMTINGKPWVADKFAFASQQQGITAIYGMSNDRKNFIITLSATTTGEYQLDQTSLHAAAWSDSTETNAEGYTTNQGNSLADAGGKVFLTSIDAARKTLSGTFQFNMFRELDNGRKAVVNGIFENVSFGTPDPPGSGGSTTGGGTATGNTLTANIDGAVYSAKRVVGIAALGSLSINGSENDGTKAVGIQVPDNITTGTYDLSMFSGYVGVYVVSISESYTAESGKLVITEHNKSTKKIKGTFAFKASNLLSPGAVKDITSGTFSVAY